MPPRLLEPREINLQVRSVPQLAEISTDLLTIDCWRVGDNPGMDLMFNWERQRFEGSDIGRLSSKVLALLQSFQSTRLFMLCDLYAEENTPQEGIVWAHEDRVKGAILGVMSCLLVLVRKDSFRRLLFERPERLVIATIENDSIVLQEGEGAKMVSFLRDRKD